VEAPLLLAIDGNSLLHRAYHAHEESGHRTTDGRPCWAINGLWSQLLAAVNRVDPAAVLLAFDDPAANDRKVSHPAYKAHRADKPADLVAQLADAPVHVARTGLTVRVEPGPRPTTCWPVRRRRRSGPAGAPCWPPPTGTRSR